MFQDPSSFCTGPKIFLNIIRSNILRYCSSRFVNVQAFLNSTCLYTINIQTPMSTHTLSPYHQSPCHLPPHHQHTSYLPQCVSTPNITCPAPASDSNRHQTDSYDCPKMPPSYFTFHKRKRFSKRLGLAPNLTAR